ncbi:MAG TPA: hypothetical protein VG713_13165, partial [Pirellulales bacterium]|nr:hypothetical protein [Pirellulales bacterium]
MITVSTHMSPAAPTNSSPLSDSAWSVAMPDALAAQAVTVGASLRHSMQTGFVVYEGASGRPLHIASDLPGIAWSNFSELIREVARGTTARLIEEEDPLLLQAIPLVTADKAVLVAAGLYLSRPVESPADVVRAAQVFGLSPEQLFHWCRQQKPVTIETITRMTDVLTAKLHA